MKYAGVAELAKLLGHKNNKVVAVWRHRGQIPEPDFVLASGPVWDLSRADMQKWLEKARRKNVNK